MPGATCAKLTTGPVVGDGGPLASTLAPLFGVFEGATKWAWPEMMLSFAQAFILFSVDGRKEGFENER